MTTCSSGTSPEVSNVRIVGCDGGDVFHIAGEDAGVEGVKLLKGGLQALWEAPIRVVERTPIKMDGGILRAVKTAIMEPVITVGISRKLVNETFGVVDGALREAFSFEKDPYYDQSTLARIEWETEDSTRWIEVVLTEGQSFDAELLPQHHGSWVWEIHLKNYDAYWREPDAVEPLTFSSAGTQSMPISNPTGVDMPPAWVGTRAQWTVADNTWSGKAWERVPGGSYPDRSLLYPNLTADNGGIKIDLDPSRLPVRDAFDRNLVGQMPVRGDYPKNLIPRFTQPTTVEVTAANVPVGGAMIQCRQPRRFRRAWGRV